MSVLIEDVDTSALDSLLAKVYREKGYNFRDFRPGPIARRLKQRLRATGTTTYQDYSRYLDTHYDEYELLAETLVIKTSSFFRNAYTYQQVAEVVIPGLVSQKNGSKEQSLQIWSNACACGEEPYSVAILLAEYLGENISRYDITIHSTDISNKSLSVAAEGRFSPNSLTNLPPAFLEKYFRTKNGYHCVKYGIRCLLNFAYFDLTSSTRPPFTGLGCVFCCNVLIYMKPELQGRVIDMIYDSLDESGFLVLGETETPGPKMREKFVCLDEIAKIYRKKQ